MTIKSKDVNSTFSFSESYATALEVVYGVVYGSIPWIIKNGYFNEDTTEKTKKRKSRKFWKSTSFLEEMDLSAISGSATEHYDSWGPESRKRVFIASFREKFDDVHHGIDREKREVCEMIITLYSGGKGFGGSEWRFESLVIKTKEKNIPWGYFPEED